MVRGRLQIIAREKRTFECKEMAVLLEAKGGVLIQRPWLSLQGLWVPTLGTLPCHLPSL